MNTRWQRAALMTAAGIWATSASAATIHVPGEAGTIQAGITLAADGDTVLVADGLYSGLGNRGIDVMGKRITIVSEGGPSACTIDCGYSDRAFLLAGGESTETRIEGFTITKGAIGGFNGQGGAILVPSGSGLTVADCIFQSNGTGIHGKGGAIWSYGDLVVLDTTFVSNHVTETFALGGAVCSAGSAEFRRCSFVSNVNNEALGGAIYSEGPLLLEACSFDTNSSGWGGAVYTTAAAATIRDCSFTENLSHNLSAGVGFGGGVAVTGGTVTFERCVFDANRGHAGGAVSSTGASTSTSFADCIFLANLASSIGGGAVYGSGVSAVNCLFSGNTSATPGGALQLTAGSCVLADCSLAGNEQTAGAGGGGVNLAGASLVLVNSILWGNTDAGPSAQAAQITVSSGTVSVGHTDVEGWDGTLGGTGNFGEDPQFADALGPDGQAGTSDDDLHLRPGSPCIDAGDNESVPAGVTQDLDGGARIVSGVVDLGAYETHAGPCPADVDGNGDVGFSDLLSVVSTWGACTGCPADVDGDGEVGFLDLVSVLSAWGPCP
jgi:hypothetical protein